MGSFGSFIPARSRPAQSVEPAVIAGRDVDRTGLRDGIRGSGDEDPFALDHTGAGFEDEPAGVWGPVEGGICGGSGDGKFGHGDAGSKAHQLDGLDRGDLGRLERFRGHGQGEDLAGCDGDIVELDIVAGDCIEPFIQDESASGDNLSHQPPNAS